MTVAAQIERTDTPAPDDAAPKTTAEPKGSMKVSERLAASAAARVEDAEKVRADYEKATKQTIPGLMSERDLAKNKVTELEDELQTVYSVLETNEAMDARWISWLEKVMPQVESGKMTPKQLVDFTKQSIAKAHADTRAKVEGKAAAAKADASGAGAAELILDLTDTEPDLAKWLRGQVKRGLITLTKDNLPKHREAFAELRGEPKRDETPAARTVVTRPVPPTTPSAGGGAGAGAPAYRKGVSAKELLAQGVAQMAGSVRR